MKRGLSIPETDTRKQPIRTRYLGHLTGYQPIRDQFPLIRPVPAVYQDDYNILKARFYTTDTSKQPIRTRYLSHVTGCQPIRDQYIFIGSHLRIPIQQSSVLNSTEKQKA
eukprot:sb/3477295/